MENNSDTPPKTPQETSPKTPKETMPEADRSPYESYRGQYIIATPGMGDPRFKGAVIYLCGHDASGAMGIVINRSKMGLTVSDLLDHIGVEGEVKVADTAVLEGGPVDIDRGFVLHSPDWFREDATLKVTDAVGLTTTKDILEALVSEKAPERAVLAVGYAGWGPGQLESEIMQNAWLVCGGDAGLVFDGDLDRKWVDALARIGISPEQLSAFGGSA